MDFVEKGVKEKSRSFFTEYDFELVDNGVTVCHLAAMEIVPNLELDLTVMTDENHFRMGYATEGIRRMIRWAIKHEYQQVRMTNVFGSPAIGKIAEKFGFTWRGGKVWTKSILGPLNL